ncbi:SpoIIE family protein phosphatase [Streptomyces iconiensis]|uniref:SpoIIE family protein phosphatase n=1 Tax=Streptomyces iconiensis TaxID=1384038 RepID=A0ABT7A4E0_9ACTN|nr:fused response regulator/phosphatase [Streptomyces iconiensis]MDJ1135912.1 SpoIIE family protein phosphatase [Streptomyces iconiensis]
MPVSAPSAAASPEAAGQERADTGGLTLLVIEDDPAGTVSVPGMLDSSGKPVRVRTARNLTEAARLLTDDVHCILLDLALPCEEGGGPTGPAEAAVTGAESPGPSGTRGQAKGAGGPGCRLEYADSAAPAGPVGDAGYAGQVRGAAGVARGEFIDGLSGDGTGEDGGEGPDGEAEDGEARAEGPDELAILRRVLRMAPRHAVLALTDGTDAERAADAVRVGAQDYLFRDELDGSLLTRAIRYAVERKRADLAQRQLTETRLRAQENARLERGLLPRPLLEGSELRFAARYRPGRSRALLGGDFYDTVRTADGTVHAMIGDVCGHGPDEAALGVELRIAWRALTFAGLCGDTLLGTLQKVLEHERDSEEIFATLCTVDIDPDGRSAGVCLAGHPSPLFAGSGGAAPKLLPYDESGPALGLLPQARWPRRQVTLGRSWSLMMYTDGLIEGHVNGQGRERLGQQGMLDIVARRLAEGARGESLLDATMGDVRNLNGGELTDDVAVLLLDRDK